MGDLLENAVNLGLKKKGAFVLQTDEISRVCPPPLN